MPDTDRPLSPHLQIYRWQITMLLSILHRATGVVLSMGLLVLVAWLLAAASGPETYAGFRAVISSPLGLAVLAALVGCFSLHFLNGIRHLFWDAGLGFEKPQYYASGWSVVIGAVVLTALLAAIAAGLIGGSA